MSEGPCISVQTKITADGKLMLGSLWCSLLVIILMIGKEYGLQVKKNIEDFELKRLEVQHTKVGKVL